MSCVIYAMQRTEGRPYAWFESVPTSFRARAVADLDSR